MDIVDRLRTIMDPPNYETSLAFEAADEIEQLREALQCVVFYWDEWKDAPDGHITALSLEEVVNIARDALKGKK